MSTQRIGIAVFGATSRMARIHHLPALIAMRDVGGLEMPDGRRVIPDPILVGRDAQRLGALATSLGLEKYSTDLDAVLADGTVQVYFDTATPRDREIRLTKALASGCHVYSEKPLVADPAAGLELIEMAEAKNLKHGVVEDKLYLPGIAKLRHLVRGGFFGHIHRFHLEFGNWVFDGTGDVPCQRSSWNYQAHTMGGIALDMFPHWRYILEDLVGKIEELSAVAWTAIPERVNEDGQTYMVDVEDTCACLVSMKGGVHGTIAASWATRVRREDVFSLQIDGSNGSAVASYLHCHAQPANLTPVAMSSLGGHLETNHLKAWSEVPQYGNPQGSYWTGWAEFLRHVHIDHPLRSSFREGVRDVSFGLLVRESAELKTWVSLPPETTI